MSIVINMKTKDIRVDEIICLVTSIDFREWLFKELEDRNWSQRDLAKKAKISQGAISHVINGARQPGTDFCQAIAVAFGYAPETVFRVAGLLPTHKDMDEETEQMLYLFDRLETADQEVLLNMAKFFLNRREQSKTTRPRQAEG